MICKLYTKALVISFVFLLSACGGGDSKTDDTTKTEIADNKSEEGVSSYTSIYMAGSDLEEDIGVASEDLNEIIDGYNRLTLSQKEKSDILVAFGGSRKENWQGIKYSDIECLIEDAKDSKFGNASCYLYENKDSNMGSSSTLEHFLNFSKADIQKSEKKFLIFWNHGGAYEGVCYDSNKEFDKLSIAELNTALKQTESNFDVIGMDACLMANIEVSKGIKDYTKYFLASEELEPGHGWDYEDVISLIGSSDSSLDDLGKSLVDSYIDSQKHSQTEDKTLSFLDLTKLDSVIDKIDILSQNLNGIDDFKDIGYSSLKSQKYGMNDRYLDGITIDLKNFALQITSNNENIKSYADSLADSIDDLVVYSRNQSSKEGSYGVSIYQPLNEKDWQKYDSISYVASKNWYELLSSFTVIKGSDKEEPTINSEQECSENNTSGQCLDISDNIAVKSVTSYGWMPYGDSYVLLYAQNLNNSNNSYFMPTFEDNWHYICDGSSDECIIPSAIEVSIDGIDNLYYTHGQYNGIDSVLYFQISSSGSVKFWAIPKSENEFGSKTQYYVKAGDTIRLDFIVYSASSGLSIEEGNTLTFTQNPVWKKETLNVDLEYYAIAEDFNNNTNVSNMYSSQSSPQNLDTNTTEYSRLSDIAGKTIYFNYDYYGTTYNDNIVLSSDINSTQSGYYISGTIGNGADAFCYSPDDTTLITVNGQEHSYMCVYYSNYGSKELYVFNVENDISIDGYYSYLSSSSDENIFVSIQIPDAFFEMSYIY